MDTTEIRERIQTYFDASYECSGEKMASVFHPAAHIYGRGDDGALRAMSRDVFAELVGSSKPGQEHTYAREDEILSIDFASDHTAVARVKLRVGNTAFSDILSFMCLDGRWGVIAKLYSGAEIRE